MDLMPAVATLPQRSSPAGLACGTAEAVMTAHVSTPLSRHVFVWWRGTRIMVSTDASLPQRFLLASMARGAAGMIEALHGRSDGGLDAKAGQRRHRPLGFRQRANQGRSE